MDAGDHEHFDQDALAQRWHLSARTLEAWRQQGHGPAFWHLGRQVRYRREDVLAYEAERLRVSTSMAANGTRVRA